MLTECSRGKVSVVLLKNVKKKSARGFCLFCCRGAGIQCTKGFVGVTDFILFFVRKGAGVDPLKYFQFCERMTWVAYQLNNKTNGVFIIL